MLLVPPTLLAVALAMDAAAVSAALAIGGAPRAVWLQAAASFGVFQAAMAGAGALGGTLLAQWGGGWEDWLAALVLALLGLRMLLPSDDDAEVSRSRILALSVATSIDALAAGVTLPMLDAPVWLSLTLIGTVTAALSLAAAGVGSRLGDLAGHRAEQLGGLVLIGLAVHLLF